MFDLRFALQEFFRQDPTTYVATNLLLYYVEGNPYKSVAPDVFVVRGVGNRQRRIYQLWEEGRPPDVVIEISSRATCLEDLQRKWQLYARLGVAEYFIFDPEYSYLEGRPLIGYRLRDGEYEELTVTDGHLHSERLGLDLVDTGATLRLWNPATREFLRTPAEAEAAALRETQAREQAEAEIARLRAELAQLKGGT
jgi:Uma2 family endonuclease